MRVRCVTFHGYPHGYKALGIGARCGWLADNYVDYSDVARVIKITDAPSMVGASRVSEYEMRKRSSS
jgi:hypothetical protein